MTRGTWIIAAAAGMALAASTGHSQPWMRGNANGGILNPVFPDETAIGRETLGRINEFLAAGNSGSAVRELQRLLDEEADRVVPADAAGEVFVPVREAVHRLLGERPEVLKLYRESESATAERQLKGGDAAGVERSRLLTPAGFDAAIDVARGQLEAASFEAARITLEALTTHPDRSGARAKAAAALATTVARYLDRADAWAWADRWRAEAGDGSARPAAFTRPGALAEPEWSSSREAPDLPVDGVPSRPLWSSRLEPESLPEDVSQLREPDLPVEQIVDNQWVVPTVVGDTIYINDGTFVTARDRYTLTPRWTVRPASEGQEDPFVVRRLATTRSQGRQVEDVSTVSVVGASGSSGGTLIATMGLAMGGAREGSVATVAIDTATGRVLWSIEVDRLDPLLDGASVRGPALIDPLGGGTVVLAVRRPTLGRRTVSQALVGLDLETGTLRWVRPVASAGSIPWGGGARGVGFAPVLDRGVVYTLDTLGVMAAVEASTGRTRWVRTMPAPSVPLGGGVEGRLPWQWMEPIVDGSSLVTLTPDRSRVVRVALADGSIEASRLSAELGEPQYLVRAGDQIGAVSAAGVSFVPIADIAKGTVRRVRTGEAGSIRGRVLAGPTGVHVPRIDGVAFYPIPRDERAVEPTLVRLEKPGTLVALADQVFTIDAASVHNYLSFEAADTRLTARMKADPLDPEPAVTAAQLAYHAGKLERIAPTADAAIRAIESDPKRPVASAQRERLLAALMLMVDQSQSRWEQPAPGSERRKEEGAAANVPAAIDLPWMEQVLVRVGRLAQTPPERATHLLALGRFQDAADRPALGIEAYQRILAEPGLSGAAWTSAGVTARADLEATRRIRSLVAEHGSKAYAAFDADAANRIAGLGASPSLEALEGLAREFPASRSAAAALVRVSELHEAAGRPQPAIAALREALEIAESTAEDEAGAAIGIGEIAGRLLTLLDRNDKLFSAWQTLIRLRQTHAGLTLSVRGTSIDEAALAAKIEQKMASSRRLPRVGGEVVGDPVVLAGWSIMPMRSRGSIDRACEQVMMINAGLNRVALFVAGPSASEPMAASWHRNFGQAAPVLVRYDAETVDLVWESAPEHAAGKTLGTGPMIERISSADGRTLWFSAGLSELLPVREDAAELARRGELMVTSDAGVVVVADRVGRVAGIDAATGQTLWRRQTPVQAVADMAQASGVLTLGGLSADPNSPRARPVLVVLDARRGEVVHRLDDLGSPVRWLRVVGGEMGGAAGADRAVPTAIVAGLNSAVVAIDPAGGRVNWSLSGVPAAAALEAFVFGPRMFLLDSNRQMWMGSTVTGQVNPRPLPSMDHFIGATIEATALPENRTAFSSDRGVCVFDERGELVGIDGLNAGPDMVVLPPTATRGGFLTIEASARAGENGFRLHMLDSASARLRWTRTVIGFEISPRRMVAIDGRVLISSGGSTAVLVMAEEAR